LNCVKLTYLLINLYLSMENPFFWLFEMYHTLLLSVGILLYTKASCSYPTVTQYTLTNLSLFLSPLLALASGNHCSILNFYVIILLRFHIWIRSCGTYISVPDLFHLDNDLHFHLCCRKWQNFILFMAQ
jgi:hypothetical protein